MSELKFNNKIYRKKAVKEAISAYSHLAKFRVCDSGSYLKVKIDAKDSKDKVMLADEFVNYVLGATKKCL